MNIKASSSTSLFYLIFLFFLLKRRFLSVAEKNHDLFVQNFA